MGIFATGSTTPGSHRPVDLRDHHAPDRLAVDTFWAFSPVRRDLAIPKEQIEAARVDGASEGQLFRHITLPAIRPLLMILTFLSIIWDFKVFTQIYTMLQGGPTARPSPSPSTPTSKASAKAGTASQQRSPS